MKNLFFTFLVLFNCCLFPTMSGWIAIAQTLDPYKFFPSSVGNVWEYSGIWGGREEIYKDSIGTDGSRYLFYRVNNSFYQNPVYKLDTLYRCFSYNWLYYKLDANVGDHWMVKPETSGSPRLEARVLNKFPSVVFGRETIIMKIGYFFYFQWPDTVIAWESWREYLAYGIGEVMTWDMEGGPVRILKGCIIDGDTIGTITSVDDINSNILSFELFQNYPNPFNPKTTIKYSINETSKVKLTVYSLLGEEIKVLVDEYKNAGTYTATFDANDLPSGVYIYSLISGNKSASKKMLLIK